MPRTVRCRPYRLAAFARSPRLQTWRTLDSPQHLLKFARDLRCVNRNRWTITIPDCARVVENYNLGDHVFAVGRRVIRREGRNHASSEVAGRDVISDADTNNVATFSLADIGAIDLNGFHLSNVATG